VHDQSQLREYLKALLGKNDLEGQGAFGIIAESKGGATNHPDNCLFALGSSFNRSIGNRFDHLNAFLAGKQKTQNAVQAPMDFGSYDPLKKWRIQQQRERRGGTPFREGTEADDGGPCQGACFPIIRAGSPWFGACMRHSVQHH